jgi:hypothetical protein
MFPKYILWLRGAANQEALGVLRAGLPAYHFEDPVDPPMKAFFLSRSIEVRACLGTARGMLGTGRVEAAKQWAKQVMMIQPGPTWVKKAGSADSAKGAIKR